MKISRSPLAFAAVSFAFGIGCGMANTWTVFAVALPVFYFGLCLKHKAIRPLPAWMFFGAMGWITGFLHASQDTEQRSSDWFVLEERLWSNSNWSAWKVSEGGCTSSCFKFTLIAQADIAIDWSHSAQIRISPFRLDQLDEKVCEGTEAEKVIFIQSCRDFLLWSPPRDWMDKARQSWIDGIKAVGFDAQTESLLQVLLAGDKSSLDEAHQKDYRSAGVAHALAVSGMHVSLIFMMVFLPFKAVPKKWHKWSILPVLTTMWSFVMVVGFSASSVRAATMLSTWLIGKLIWSRSSPLNSCWLAILLMLTFRPDWLFDVGFQLSCLAVLGLLICFPALSQRFQIKWRLLRYGAQIMMISLIAQLSLLPLIWYNFKELPTYFLLSNLIVAPLLPLIMGVGAVCTVLQFFGFHMPMMVLNLLNAVVAFMQNILHAIANWPIATITLAKIDLPQAVLAGLITWLTMLGFSYRHFWLTYSGLLGVAVLWLGRICIDFFHW